MPPSIKKQIPTANPKRKVGGSVVDRIGEYDFDQPEGIKILIYGKSKTGKSRTIATFPGPILWIICSGGNKSGELRSIPLEHRKKIKAVTVNSSMEVRTLIEHARDSGLYKTVALDHGTGLQDRVLAEILKVDELPAQMKWGTASRDQYMDAGTQCRELFRMLLSLSCNVVIAGQERAPKDVGDDNEMLLPTVGVELMPSLAGWLHPAVDFIVQTFKKQKTIVKTSKINGKDVNIEVAVPGADFCLRTGPHGIYNTGFRTPIDNAPDYIVNPSYDKIMQIVNGTYKGTK
jgi:hypothetical protein